MDSVGGARVDREGLQLTAKVSCHGQLLSRIRVGDRGPASWMLRDVPLEPAHSP